MLKECQDPAACPLFGAFWASNGQPCTYSLGRFAAQALCMVPAEEAAAVGCARARAQRPPGARGTAGVRRILALQLPARMSLPIVSYLAAHHSVDACLCCRYFHPFIAHDVPVTHCISTAHCSTAKSSLLDSRCGICAKTKMVSKRLHRRQQQLCIAKPLP